MVHLILPSILQAVAMTISVQKHLNCNRKYRFHSLSILYCREHSFSNFNICIYIHICIMCVFMYIKYFKHCLSLLRARNY